MDSFITRREFEPVKKDAAAAKGLAEKNEQSIKDICKDQMEFKETNNQEHTNMLLAIAKAVEQISSNDETLSDIKKILWWLLCTVIVSLTGAAGTAIWYVITHS